MPDENKSNSILSEEYVEKIKELSIHLKEAHAIYESLPDCIKAVDKNNIRYYLSNSVNFTNELAWSFNIDTDYNLTKMI